MDKMTLTDIVDLVRDAAKMATDVVLDAFLEAIEGEKGEPQKCAERSSLLFLSDLDGSFGLAETLREAARKIPVARGSLEVLSLRAFEGLSTIVYQVTTEGERLPSLTVSRLKDGTIGIVSYDPDGGSPTFWGRILSGRVHVSTAKEQINSLDVAHETLGVLIKESKTISEVELEVQQPSRAEDMDAECRTLNQAACFVDGVFEAIPINPVEPDGRILVSSGDGNNFTLICVSRNAALNSCVMAVFSRNPDSYLGAVHWQDGCAVICLAGEIIRQDKYRDALLGILTAKPVSFIATCAPLLLSGVLDSEVLADEGDTPFPDPTGKSGCALVSEKGDAVFCNAGDYAQSGASGNPITPQEDIDQFKECAARLLGRPSEDCTQEPLLKANLLNFVQSSPLQGGDLLSEKLARAIAAVILLSPFVSASEDCTKFFSIDFLHTLLKLSRDCRSEDLAVKEDLANVIAMALVKTGAIPLDEALLCIRNTR